MPPDRTADDQTPKGWVPLENRLYRRDIVYDTLQWSLQPAQLANALVAPAPSAGPLAIIPDSGWGLSFALAIYTLSGRLISRFDRLREKTVPPFRAVSLAWSVDDLLSIVYNDGVILRVPAGLHLANMRFIRAFPSRANERVYDATVVHAGDVVLRTASGKIFTVDVHDAVQTDRLVAPPAEGVVCDVPNCGIAAVKRDQSPHTAVDTLVVTNEGRITITNSNSPYTLRPEDAVSQIAASNNGLYVAAIDENSGSLFVSTIDLNSQVIARVDLVVELSLLGVENLYSDVIFDATTPETIAWVGSDAVAVLYKEHLVLVGPHDGLAVFNLEEAFSAGGIVLHNEVDGLRIISSSGIQFVHMVPEPVNVVMCQKQAPGYKLLRSSTSADDKFDMKTVDTLTRYRLLRELRDSGGLMEAARSCISAAYLETNVSMQKRLLHAASYGARHATVFAKDSKKPDAPHSRKSGDPRLSRKIDEQKRLDVDLVPTAIAVLRVVNAVGRPSAGIPLTKPQFDALGLKSVAARLSRYGQHTLALRLASFGGISPYDVLSEWAGAIMEANENESDEALTTWITERFNRMNNMSDGHGSRANRPLPFVKAAEAAYVIGRPKCAEMLLGRETRPAPKVTMYLRMGREGPAIMAAVSSGDPELVLDALGTVLEKKSVRETARLLRSLPPALGNRATDLLASHLRQIGDMNALRWVYVENGRHREAALVDIHQINAIQDTHEYIAALEAAAVALARGHGRKACQFEIQALQHAANVAACAMEVEKWGRLEVGTLRHASDGDLLARAIVDIGDKKKRRDVLARLRRDLRMPDRRFFWVCLDSMAEVGDFESIEALSYSAGDAKVPPIGLMAFVDTCIKHGMEEEAMKYVTRITDPRDRARGLARCGHGREAADIVSRFRNQQLLDEVQDLAARHVAIISSQADRKKGVTSSKSSSTRT